MEKPSLTPAERLIVVCLRHAPGLTAPAIAAECGLNPHYTLRLIRVLALTGTIERDSDSGYHLTLEVK